MASMLDAINEFRNEFIITIEDPIEYVFKNKKSIFSQREIGRDTLSFSQAIRSAMHQEPHLRPQDVDELERALAESRLPVREAGAFDKAE